MLERFSLLELRMKHMTKHLVERRIHVNFIAENWLTIVFVASMLILGISMIINFCESTKEEQIKKIKEWLLYATILAEKELGGGTGRLKLRYVYDMFIVKFPWLSKLFSFDRFSEFVDDALYEMKELIATNDAVNSYVSNTIETEVEFKNE